MQSQLNFGHGSRTVGLRLSLFSFIGVNSSTQKMGFHALTIHFLVVSNQSDQLLIGQFWPGIFYRSEHSAHLDRISGTVFPEKKFPVKLCQASQKLVDYMIYYMYIFHFDLFWGDKKSWSTISTILCWYTDHTWYFLPALQQFHRPTQLAIYVNHIYFTDLRLGTIPKWHQISDWDSERTAKTICLLHHAWPLLIDLPQRIRIRNATHVEVLVS